MAYLEAELSGMFRVYVHPVTLALLKTSNLLASEDSSRASQASRLCPALPPKLERIVQRNALSTERNKDKTRCIATFAHLPAVAFVFLATASALASST